MNANSFATEQLQSLIERIERLEEEKKALSEDIKQVFSEAKNNGFDPKIMREVLKIRKMERNERQEVEAMVDLYLSALGERTLGSGQVETNSEERMVG